MINPQKVQQQLLFILLPSHMQCNECADTLLKIIGILPQLYTGSQLTTIIRIKIIKIYYYN
jgi:hypothetical protein